VLLVGALERGGQKSVVRHAQQHARGGSGAGEYARKHADECTAVDGDPERRNPSLRGEKCRGLVVSLSAVDAPRKPTTSE